MNYAQLNEQADALSKVMESVMDIVTNDSRYVPSVFNFIGYDDDLNELLIDPTQDGMYVIKEGNMDELFDLLGLTEVYNDMEEKRNNLFSDMMDMEDKMAAQSFDSDFIEMTEGCMTDDEYDCFYN